MRISTYKRIKKDYSDDVYIRTKFLKKENPWLEKDVDIIDTLVGLGTTYIDFTATSNNDYLYVQTFHSASQGSNGYVYVLKKM
ncbi:hypothetical protein KRX57_04720 [Weeksellaceae bacterium TAE3-ERU29]|nr:hypothetical protein [Weeksellaceae bacterium TAE3-ERU29]